MIIFNLPSANVFRRTYSRVFLLILALFVATYLTCYVHEVRPKDIETDFSGPLLAVGQPLPVWTHPENPIRKYCSKHHLDIDDIYVFKKELGSGYEGVARLYTDKDSGEDVVIKTYFSDTFRDPLPESLLESFDIQMTSWPTEIPASILMSFIINTMATSGLTNDSTTIPNHVPMLDFFLARPTSLFKTDPKWHFVTPFLPFGTLDKLSPDSFPFIGGRLQIEGDDSAHPDTPTHLTSLSTPSSFDSLYRPALLSLLRTLANLHGLGYCHNDIKSDNIYPLSPSHWLLGDFGMLRETTHPYHLTAKWKRKNQWADCRLNDVRRLLKTYLSVLRRGNEGVFDGMFYGEGEAWARLYWGWMREPVGAGEMLEMLATRIELAPGVGIGEIQGQKVGDGEESAGALAISRELTCTNLWKWPWVWWRLGGFWPRYRLEINGN